MMLVLALICGFVGSAVTVIPRNPMAEETKQIVAGLLLVVALASFGSLFAAASL